MKIGIVTTWFERGAAYVSRQFEEVLTKEHEVFIYARGGEDYAIGNPKWDKENVTWGKKILTPFTGTIIDKKEFIKWIESNNIEVVIFNEQRWWYPIIWCNELGVKTIAYVDYYTEDTLPLYDIYDVLICNTKKHFDAFKWHKGAKYIPWGTDVDLFSPIANELKGKKDVVTFFHSCGMNPRRKGTDLLLNSLSEVKKSNYKLIVHSQVSLLDFFPELSGLIKKYLAQGKLEIIEKTIPAPGLYYKGDVYVYPSRLEGIGLTVAEAVSSGLCLIVPDCGPMNEFAGDKFSKKIKVHRYFSRSDGYYWPQNEISIQDLAEGMDYYMINRDKLKEGNQAARIYALDHLDWNKNSQELEGVITVLAEKELVPLEMTKVDIINDYEKSGSKKFNDLGIKLSWLYKLYKNIT